MAHALLLSRGDQLAIFGPFEDEEAAKAYSAVLAKVGADDPEAQEDQAAIVQMVTPGVPQEASKIILLNP